MIFKYQVVVGEKVLKDRYDREDQSTKSVRNFIYKVLRGCKKLGGGGEDKLIAVMKSEVSLFSSVFHTTPEYRRVWV